MATAVLTDLGRAFINRRLGATTGGPTVGTTIAAIGWGIAAGSAYAGATSLFAETLPRVASTNSGIQTYTDNDTLVATANLTGPLGGIIVTNVGLFDATSAGNLLMMLSLDGATMTVNEGDLLAVTFQLVFL